MADTESNRETLGTVQDAARVAREWFEAEARRPGDLFYRVKDGSPGWITDLCKAAHDDCGVMPDDFRYATLVSALDMLGEFDPSQDADDPQLILDWADAVTDVYTGDLTAWLASSPYRVDYVNEVCRDGGDDLETMIRGGQCREIEEIGMAALDYLTDLVTRRGNA